MLPVVFLGTPVDEMIPPSCEDARLISRELDRQRIFLDVEVLSISLVEKTREFFEAIYPGALCARLDSSLESEENESRPTQCYRLVL
jgi:hypothetical protein